MLSRSGDAVGTRWRSARAWLLMALAVMTCAFTTHGAERLKVVTSFLPAYCFAANVAGSVADVENLLPPKATPHDYQLTPSDLRKLRDADVIVINGLGIESWLDKAMRSTARPGRITITLSDGLTSQLIKGEGEAGHEDHHDADHDHAHASDGPNPHVWLDPQLAIHGVSNIVAGLKRADATNAAAYERNAAAYIGKLRALDEELETALKPVQSHAFVTFHNAFPYFAKRYGLKLAGVVQNVPDVSPSPRALATLTRGMREKNVRAIFTEQQSPTRLGRQLARDLKISVAELSTLEGGILAANQYEMEMRRNSDTIVKILANGR